MKKVFLGGTCNESKWRDEIIRQIDGSIDYFNPVVENWTEECMAEEVKQREACDFVLYMITPLMTGVYAIAEVVDDSNKRPEKTLFCFLLEDMGENGERLTFSDGQIRSLTQVRGMVNENGAKIFGSLNQVGNFLKSQKGTEHEKTN